MEEVPENVVVRQLRGGRGPICGNLELSEMYENGVLQQDVVAAIKEDRVLGEGDAVVSIAIGAAGSGCTDGGVVYA